MIYFVKHVESFYEYIYIRRWYCGIDAYEYVELWIRDCEEEGEEDEYEKGEEREVKGDDSNVLPRMCYGYSS